MSSYASRGVGARELESDRLAHTRTLAAHADAVALLKGSRTVLAAPDGVVRVNPTGSPVLATAGSGDVLTGMIGGLLARGVPPFDAATAAPTSTAWPGSRRVADLGGHARGRPGRPHPGGRSRGVGEP